MTDLKTVCVYCGSGTGKNPAYETAAVELGREIARAGLKLVYGGGSIGLMGAVAGAALQSGGHVTGVIPRFLKEREVMMERVTELVVTEDMHERKRIMFERADAFVALPGGIGTLEEVVEMMTWGQLGRHRRPVILANIGDFWNPLERLLQHMQDEAFIRPGFEVDYHMCDRIAEVVPALQRACREAALAGRDEGAGVTDVEKL
ncbi:TIGR00730 family Rossman fold protein [Stappia sp. F7233]|uniref:Cytokinin riboside 5'-monophosphate phosphoribohydrolase n=1 Tax=Stappia albiluteola TaxID=2758565 RepID=A0A839AKH6_9HYPH|nr:TIGR00730 family Rossman fold protein [Stappia albiluteola]MBA5779382.1 TIGR00730 family Rossman fold protein [Stappia albiluteola]